MSHHDAHRPTPSTIKLADLNSLFRNAGPGTILQPPQQYPHPNAQADPARERQKLDLQKNKSKKPTDRELPEGIESIVIGDVAERYRKLREIEKRLDSTMMRKRLDLQDQTTQNSKRSRTMRIWISNTAENQPWQNTSMDPDAFDFGDTSQASYRVKIEGRLLDEEDALDGEDTKYSTATAVADGGEPMDITDAAKSSQPKSSSTQERTKLSHFFKQITVEFDRPSSLQPDGMAMVEWKRPEARPGQTNWAADGSNFDCLHFERKSDENINIRINLFRDETPERFRLSPELAELCGGITEADRASVMLNVWKYIRANKLYENEDARVVRCDALMKKACLPSRYPTRQTTNCHPRYSAWTPSNSTTSSTTFSHT
jgi:SWI/SNF-related matrix-associated actin-dependent regulator of chromatin subfamily D